MRKLGISDISFSSIPLEEQIKLFKDYGFDCFFINYYAEPLDKLKNIAAKSGIEFETVHLPFCVKKDFHINCLWEENSDGDDYVELLKKLITNCGIAEIPVAVIHPTCFNKAPDVSEIGLDRFKKLCDHAQGKNVRLAFENMELPGHLHRVMEVIGDFHGFCWDCGHNRCYTPETDMSAVYGDKLLCTHIHDNFGVTQPGNIHSHDDLHHLPYDGNLDWQWYGKRIKEIGYQGPLTLELSSKSKEKYENIPLEVLLETAFERMQKVRDFAE